MTKARPIGSSLLGLTIFIGIGCGGAQNEAIGLADGGAGGGGSAGNGMKDPADAGRADGGVEGGGTTTGLGSIELHHLPLGARVYATGTAFFEDAFNNASTVIVVATADPDVPIKVLSFDSTAAKWSTLFTVPTGGVLPKGPHRIDAVGSFITGDYAPTLIFGARTEAGLVNEGVFVARWNLGHYDLTKVPGTDAPGLTFVSFVDTSRGLVASCASSAAASPKVAAMLFSIDRDGALTLVATLPGELALDVTPSPLELSPVVTSMSVGFPSTMDFLVALMRQPSGDSAVTLTQVSATAFGPSVSLPVPPGITFTRQGDGGGPGPYVLFAGSDGLLYHLELDVTLAEVSLAAGPEHVRPGSSMWIEGDLLQGSVAGSTGIDLMVAKDLPFPLFATPRSGKTAIPTGPAIFPMSVGYGFGSNLHIFAVAAGPGGVFDTALMVVVNTSTPENPAVIFVDQQAVADGGVAKIDPAGAADVCFEQLGTYPESPYVCALPEPCAVVSGLDPTDSPGSRTSPLSLDVDAAKCALQHIRDDAPGHLKLSMSNGEGSTDEDIWVQGDGSAVVWRHSTLDLSFTDYAARRFPRKEKAFFDACLAQTTAPALYHCLYEWWVDDGCFAKGSLPCSSH